MNIRPALKRIKGQVRTWVEHRFHVVKNLFRHRKTRYKDLAKKAAQLFSLLGPANLVIAKRRLITLDSHGKDVPA
jgi:IS5 family transposase